MRDLPSTCCRVIPRRARTSGPTPGSGSEHVNVLDWCLVALVGIYALSGYWQGFVTGAFATAGLLLGGLFGVWLAPIALGDAEPSLWVSLGALFIVILSASLGQAVLQYAGARIRARIRWQPVRAVDAVGGAALSAVGRAARRVGARRRGLRLADRRRSPPTVRESAVLAKVDSVLPGQADRRAPGVQQRGRDDVLPPLPRALRARADRRRSRPARSGCSPTPTWSTRRAACSRCAAPTPAAAASRAPASSTPRAG